MLNIEHTDDVVRFRIRVQPRASKNEVSGVYQDMLKLRLTAPPVDGEANKACVEFFANRLSVPKKNVKLVAGFKGRTKTLEIKGVSAADIRGLTE
ncbi:DUF167 domain-containing protein [Metallumcola ferriviriculae]|uniref:UPF0235 protein MFMK1_001849 n=1 Tax=Metallumcola ferriviriculae TaxID=3039180 RepID=A0AAU0UKZ1_9FIRM|nr:DUF167 domain-containing protein [Desulfitibacteraceae bacterium MK1]